MELDRIDRKILTLMQQNGRISNLELAESIGLSATPCSRRVKRLEELGVIRQYVTLLDAEKLGLGIKVIISVSMDRHTPERFDNFAEQIGRFPEVVECSIVTGQEADFLVTALLPDMSFFEEFLLGRLTGIKGVTGVRSSFVLRKMIDRTDVPLNHIDNPIQSAKS